MVALQTSHPVRKPYSLNRLFQKRLFRTPGDIWNRDATTPGLAQKRADRATMRAAPDKIRFISLRPANAKFSIVKKQCSPVQLVRLHGSAPKKQKRGCFFCKHSISEANTLTTETGPHTVCSVLGLAPWGTTSGAAVDRIAVWQQTTRFGWGENVHWVGFRLFGRACRCLWE